MPAPDALVPEFRRAMRRMAATVTLLSTVGPDGRRHGMAATAVTSVTMDPPTLLVCINRSASIHDPLTARGAFGVNVLATGHEPLVGAFSGKLTGEDRFGLGPWTADPLTGLPLLADAQCALVCEVDQVTTVGTHSVVIARVVAARSRDAVSPLVYLDGGFASVAAGETA